MKRFVIVGALALMQSACTQNASFIVGHWDGQGPAPEPPPGVERHQSALKIGAQEMIFQTQKVEGVEIEGSYYKKISGQGQAEYMDFRWMSKIPLSVRRDLLLMRAQKYFVLAYFLKAHENLRLRDLVASPALSLRMEESPQVLWKLIFEEADGTLRAYYLDKDMIIVRQEKLGSEFIDATAHLFPEGPLKSDLQQVLLRGLLNNKELASSAVRVSTEADQSAQLGEGNEFDFTVNDSRFSQVQVFFYLSQTLAWFETNLGFHLPFTLEAETQKGFPEKTNTAFYFQHKIRLGDGDGEVFDRIPMDPSIVTHESVHAVIESVAGLPYIGEGGSLNEAFADFFAAMQLNNPKMGEAAYKKAPFKRTLENDLKLQDKTGGLYHDSGIVSGLLWSLQKDLERPLALKIAWQTLIRMTPFSDFNSFRNELLAVAAKESLETQNRVQAELKNRGWTP
jgi:hypothetical protein